MRSKALQSYCCTAPKCCLASTALHTAMYGLTLGRTCSTKNSCAIHCTALAGPMNHSHSITSTALLCTALQSRKIQLSGYVLLECLHCFASKSKALPCLAAAPLQLSCGPPSSTALLSSQAQPTGPRALQLCFAAAQRPFI